MVKAWKFLPHVTESIDKVNVVCIIRQMFITEVKND
jgi:hypothetical protein